MNKRHLHHVRTKLRLIKPWYFLGLAIISATICVFALRANNQHMVELRDAVYAADKEGSGVQTSLENLQAYVTRHMNTDLSTGTSVYPPIQLKYTYDRLVRERANRLANSNDQLYTKAQRYCEQQNPTGFSGRGRVACIERYVETHATAAQLPPIPDALYKFSFSSPTWSSDLAGWSLLVTGASSLLFVVTFIGLNLAKRASR